MPLKKTNGLYRGKVRIGVTQDGKPIDKFVSGKTVKELEVAKEAARDHFIYTAQLQTQVVRLLCLSAPTSFMRRKHTQLFQEMLEETIKLYHERRKHLSAEEAGETQEAATEEIIRNATEQALQILREMNADRESFRKAGLTFEEKAFYDILMALRDQYNFEFGTDVVTDGIRINDKCRMLAKKIKEIIDTKSSFADWLNNQIVRDQLKFDIKVCLIKNGYPPQYSPEVFRKVMEQVENFEENN